MTVKVFGLWTENVIVRLLPSGVRSDEKLAVPFNVSADTVPALADAVPEPVVVK